MEKIQIGQQGLEVSKIGLGCMGMTTGFGQPKDQEEMRKVIKQAYLDGITLFDTAGSYQATLEDGTVLYNEELVGNALQDIPRENIVLASKFGIIQEDGKQVYCAKKEVIKNCLEQSLQRLKTEYIDLYYLHRVDPNTPIEEVAQTIKELIQEGKIHYWGMSEAPIELVERAHKICPLTAVENEYSLLCREIEETGYKQRIEQLGIGIVAYAPLGKAFLTGKLNLDQHFTSDDPRSRQPRFDRTIMEENLSLVNYIQEIANQKNATPAQIAIAWLQAQSGVVVPIPGSTNTKRIKENIEACKIQLSQKELQIMKDKIDQMDLYTKRFDPLFKKTKQGE